MSSARNLTAHIAALAAIRAMNKKNVGIGLTIHVGLGGNTPDTRVQVTDGGAEILQAIESALLETMKLTAALTRAELSDAAAALEQYSKIQ